MENHILYCYKEWLKKEEGDLFKQIFKIPVMARVLLGFLLLVLIGFFVILGCSINGNDVTISTLILGAIYIILCIILSIYTERYQVKHSKLGLENYKKYCKDMSNSVLTENGISNEFIPELIKRFNVMSCEIDEKIKLKHDHLNKFMEMLLIPISALILGALLDKSIDTVETVTLGVSGVLIILIVYAIIIFISFLYDIAMRFPQGKYKEFVTDLQSILDFKKCENTDESCDDIVASSLIENTSESANVHS
ncbi:MAG: hypothetical protein HDT42_09510 [Ruminococcaceae bacterium]|nr:hypothetical protein [Oscillospiraceae bacterium]